MELALGERERRYRELLAAVTNYTYSVNLANGEPVATDHSLGCLAITGYAPEDYKSDPYLWIPMVHPDDRETVRRYVAAILGGEKVPAIEHRIVRRDGAIRWLRATIVRHHDGNRLVRYDGLVEDVTERRRVEQALREQEMQLLARRRSRNGSCPSPLRTARLRHWRRVVSGRVHGRGLLRLSGDAQRDRGVCRQ